MINRAALLLRYKPAALKWLIENNPDDQPLEITLEDLNRECTTFLVADQDAEDDEATGLWISKNFRAMFEHQLESLYLDEDLWPDPLSLELFKSWFEVECHSMVIDTVGEPILNEDLEAEPGPPDHLLN